MSEFETLEEYQKSMKDFKAKCISGFENFIVSSGDERAKLQLRCTPHTDKKGGYGCHDLDFGLSIWEKKQSEIDQLKAEKAGLEKQLKYQEAAYKNVKLQFLNKEMDCSALEKALRSGQADAKTNWNACKETVRKDLERKRAERGES